MKKPSVFVIFLTVFMDLIGFGIIIPLLPMYSRHYGAHGWENGAIIASFSAMQFVFAPIWGRWSDRVGRRPILLISTAGASLSYVLFAVGSGLADHRAALWVLLASRMFAGMCGGNITVAQAYIADITPPEERSAKMGLIGMAFGLGFIFGPAIGGPSYKYLGATGPGWVAAGMCAVNFLLALAILKESRAPGSESAKPRPHLSQWMHTLSHPKLGLLVTVFFLATFCFSCFESTLAFVVSDNFHLGFQRDSDSSPTVVSFLFVYCGLIGAYIQGRAIKRLIKKLGEPRVIAVSLVLTGVSLALLPFVKGTANLSWSVLVHPEGRPWWLLLFGLALLSVGTNLTRPPLFGMLSNLAPAAEQGATIGVAQSAGSLARIIGPLYATSLYDRIPYLPYVICAGIAILTGLAAAQKLVQRDSAVSPNAANVPS